VAFGGSCRFVGLGFGAIQSGLFVYEAFRTGNYAPPLVIDVRPDLVAGLRSDSGHFRVNIARADRIDVAEMGPINVADSSVASEAELVVEAIAGADEFASALPSVAFYRTDGPSSPHRLLAEGLRRRTRSEPLIVFCAENHRSAAQLLEVAVLESVSAGERDAVAARARYVDTVIGKMSGLITDEAELAQHDLAPINSALLAAFLVEEFDRILVSRVGEGLHPGMPVLREVDDLAPFEDAKLLGHNATHALAGFMGSLLGLTLVGDLHEVDGAMGFLRAAFVEESGATLRRRWAGTDELFTEAGYTAFADDLLERMVNPFLADTVERASRDPRRKLGWDDRLVGLIRLGLAEGVPTPRYAMGVAAGLDVLRAREADHGYDADLLRAGWPDGLDPDEVGLVIDAVANGREQLEAWRRDGFEGIPQRLKE
jgi:mannitol-1-phosphate 5-dehydrogenase